MAERTVDQTDRDVNARMVSFQSIWKTVGVVLGVLVTVGGIIGSYYKGQQDVVTKIAELEIELQKDRDEARIGALEDHFELATRMELLQQNVENQADWNEDAITKMREGVETALMKHEYTFHPKTKIGGGPDPTDVVIEIPDPPKPKKVPDMKASDELEMLLKKKQEMSKAPKGYKK